MEIDVIYELDETKNQRIIIIRGEEEVPRLNIVVSPDKKMSYYHGPYLKELLKKEYLDDINMQNIREKIDGNFYMTRSIIYYLANKYNDVIFIETTEDHGVERSGMFFAPQKIGEEQFQSIVSLMDYLKKFDVIFLEDNLTNENLFDSSDTIIYEKDKIGELEDYFKNIVKSKRI